MYHLVLVLMLLSFAVSCAFGGKAEDEKLLGFSCETVRWFASQYSAEQLEALAKQYNITPEQRAAVLRCLKK